MLHLFNIFRENKDSDNCAQLLEKEFNKMYGVKTLDDGHDCNIYSVSSYNIHDVNDDCISHDNDVSYKNVNFLRSELGVQMHSKKGRYIL